MIAADRRFKDRAALDTNLVHPEHEAVKPFVLEARIERLIVDYET